MAFLIFDNEDFKEVDVLLLDYVARYQYFRRNERTQLAAALERTVDVKATPHLECT